MKDKIFHDTVHGDILVPTRYCQTIIDTFLFQRLRRIEQTSMRSLYPCARHDRFIHSIGVFHLGRIFINKISENTKNNDSELWKEIEPFWEKVKESYKIACLLHDVGHAPFSHTFEVYFDNKKIKLKEILKEIVEDENFSKDIEIYWDSKPHEKTSAYLVYSYFKDKIIQLGGDPMYVIRMILGTRYFNPSNKEQIVVNNLIPLLHGAIDVDRLDYACRDQWASGFSSARININRILGSGLLVDEEGQIKFCFNKNAVSQFESLFDIKNYQQTWVFNHQNVIYNQHLLKKTVERLAENLKEETESKDDILNEIFNLNVFIKKDYKVKNSNLYLLSDDDIIHLMKQSLDDNEYALEWLSRIHMKKPLWKSESEYTQLFNNSSSFNDEKIKTKIDSLVSQKNISNFSYEIISSERGTKTLLKNDINVYINNKIIDYTELNLGRQYNEKNYFNIYYVYINKDYLHLKDEIIAELKSI